MYLVWRELGFVVFCFSVTPLLSLGKFGVLPTDGNKGWMGAVEILFGCCVSVLFCKGIIWFKFWWKYNVSFWIVEVVEAGV